MWICGDCDRMFQAAIAKQTIGLAVKWVCPYCISENIQDFIPVRQPKFFDDQDELDVDLQKSGLLEETCGFCDDCEFTEMGDVVAENNGNRYARIPDWSPEISFDDLELNEFVLLAMDALHKFDSEFKIGKTGITDMNSRFLHTFIDGCFVP